MISAFIASAVIYATLPFSCPKRHNDEVYVKKELAILCKDIEFVDEDEFDEEN